MDSANLDEKKVAELINEKMKELQISRREKIFPYPVEEIKFLEILKSRLYIHCSTGILWHTKTSYCNNDNYTIGHMWMHMESLVGSNVLSYFVYVTAWIVNLWRFTIYVLVLHVSMSVSSHRCCLKESCFAQLCRYTCRSTMIRVQLHCQRLVSLRLVGGSSNRRLTNVTDKTENRPQLFASLPARQ